MKNGQKLWTRDELLIAVHLYCQLPFGRLHSRNPEIIHLSELIGRTANSVAYKLNNFASLDPSLQKRGIKGASNHSKLDQEIWNYFFHNIEDGINESETILDNLNQIRFSPTRNNVIKLKEGTETDRLVKSRNNQAFFRQMILSSYDFSCCITGIKNPDLLIAGHIIPWKDDPVNRLNPYNGICINALHDKAFETGLLTITPDYIIKISQKLLNEKTIESNFFEKYHNKSIVSPKRFLPDPEFLKIHNKRFKQ